MKKVIFIIAALVLGLGFVTSEAMAFGLSLDGINPYYGEVQFKFNNWDYGQLYGANTTINHGGAGSGRTDSYGVLQVTEIQGRNSGGTWQTAWAPTASEALEGWFYGISDDRVNLVNGTGTIYSTGGLIQLFLGPRNLNILAGPGTVPALGLAPTDNWNASDGTLFLQGDFVPGIVMGDNTTTLASQVDSILDPVSGRGTTYISLTGGSHQWLFDSNGQPGGADFLLSNDYRGPGDFNWTVNSYDPVTGATTTPVPEPASMLFLGMGLVGLLTAARKKKVA